MRSFNSIFAFAKVAEHLSFVGAARELGISPSAVGKTVQQLEAKLGVRLLNRTTRNVNLTAEGKIFYGHCRKILEDLDDAEAMMQHLKSAPHGVLKVTLPTIGYRFLVPMMCNFLTRYPDIELDLDFNDRTVDLVSEGQDVAIRGGNLSDSQFMTKKAGPIRFVICASPEYLAKNGYPKSPQDLRQHSCLRFRYPNTGKLQEWAIEGGEKAPIQLNSTITSNNMEAVLSSALHGLGLAYMPEFLAHEAVEQGKLICVLNEYIIRNADFWLVWPSSQHLTPKTRAFIDFMSEAFSSSNILREHKNVRAQE